MFRIGLAETMHNFKRRILMSIQISFILFLTISCASIYLFQIKEYEPFRDIIFGKGVDCQIGYEVISTDLGELSNQLIKFDAISYSLVDSVEENYMNSTRSYDIYGYDKYAIKYTPIMEEGKWISGESKGDILEAVIGQNMYGVKTGDILEVHTFDGLDKKITVKIIGVLSENAVVYSPNLFVRECGIYDWYVGEGNVELAPKLYMSRVDMEKAGIGYRTTMVLLKFDDSITDEEYEENISVLKSVGCSSYEPFYVTREKTKQIISAKVMTILPLLVCSFILVTFGVAALSVMETNADMNRYSIMYLTGMKWKGCIAICSVRALFEVIIAFAFMWLIYGGILFFGGKNIFSFIWDKRTMMVTLGMMVYFFFMTVVPPAIMMRFNSPVKLLRKSRV